AAGAWSASQDEAMTQKMREFGEKVGIAFQIKDDLFDYTADNVGKPTGNDIKEKKLTLPLIYTLNNTDRKTKKEILYIVKNENRKKSRIDYVVNAVAESGGIEYTTKKMNEYKQQALAILQVFPDSEIKKGFIDLVDYVTDRKY
ncbi:MAG: polyprenyl synthetase family protein, partial [Flavisolibacter sp.]|nr:polyprenyl synthetase family protein [Flavisolibacter sp.]